MMRRDQRRSAGLLLAATVAILFSSSATTVFAETVDLAVVLAADVSRSVDDDEFKLQRQGYAGALTNPRVLQAIAGGHAGSIAICFIEWSGPDEQQVVAPWTVIRDGETAVSFAAVLLSAPRSFVGRTSISAALDFSLNYFSGASFTAERRVIDVSGDGTNNSGRPVTDARDAVLAAGITINGLAIINEHPNPGYFAHTQPPEGLPEYYRQNVIGGPGAFLLVVRDFSTFGEAMTNKLVSEIAAVNRRSYAWLSSSGREARATVLAP
jgi:hypothetical protein